MSRTVLGPWQGLFVFVFVLKESRKVSLERVAGVSVGKAAGRQNLCPQKSAGERGEGLAELWDGRCPPVGVSGLREVRVWSDEGERPAPWTAPGLHTASLCQGLVGGWAGPGPGPSPASPGGSASSTAPGLGHLPASTVLRPSPFSRDLYLAASPAPGSLFGKEAPPPGTLTQPSGSAGSSLWFLQLAG